MHIDDSSTQFLVNKIQTDFYTESERKKEREREEEHCRQADRQASM